MISADEVSTGRVLTYKIRHSTGRLIYLSIYQASDINSQLSLHFTHIKKKPLTRIPSEQRLQRSNDERKPSSYQRQNSLALPLTHAAAVQYKEEKETIQLLI